MGRERCRYCGGEGYYFRPYEGYWLCRSCFTKSVERRVYRNIRANKLLGQDENICVALSGGKDSTATLYLLHRIIEKRGENIFAISVDEGLGEYRKASISLAKKHCKKLGIEHYIFSFKKEFGKGLKEMVKEKKNLSPCTVCGVLRRYLLNKKARELGATKIAFGFNLDDEAESIFLNFVFGNLDRLVRLGPKIENPKLKGFVPRIKPLRELPGKEVEAYLKAKGIDFHPKGICPIGKESFRKTIRKSLQEWEEKYPGTTFQILRFFDRIIEPVRRDYFSKISGKYKTCKICGEPSSREICKVCEILGRGKA